LSKNVCLVPPACPSLHMTSNHRIARDPGDCIEGEELGGYGYGRDAPCDSRAAAVWAAAASTRTARETSSARVSVSPVSPLKTKSKWHPQRAPKCDSGARGEIAEPPGPSKVRQENQLSCSIHHEGQVAIAGKENYKAHAPMLRRRGSPRESICNGKASIYPAKGEKKLRDRFAVGPLPVGVC